MNLKFYILSIFLSGILVADKSQVVFKITDKNGKPARGVLELYQNKKKIWQHKIMGEWTQPIEHGRYELWAITCDTIRMPIRIWNEQHEYQIAVKMECP